MGEHYQPLPELLTDHLAQGVWRRCLFSGWRFDNQQLVGTLDFVTEALEGISPERSSRCLQYRSTMLCLYFPGQIFSSEDDSSRLHVDLPQRVGKR